MEEKDKRKEIDREYRDKEEEGKRGEEEEIKKKGGRPRKIEELMRWSKERRSSLESVEEYLKKKRERGEEGEEEEEMRELRRSRKTENTQGETWLEMEELRKIISEEMKRVMREELGELKKEIWKKEEEWKKEREEMREKIERLERRVKDIEEKKGDKKGEDRGAGGEIEKRVGNIERNWETMEREKRRKNIVIRGLEVKNGKRREKAEKLLEEIEAKAKILKIKKIGEDREKGREMVVLELEKEEQKWEVMQKKKKLRGRRERIEVDLTWKERRTRWKLGEIARMEEGRGERTWVGNGRIRIGEKWWKWDEEREVLRDEKGNIRETERGEEEGRRGETGS